ncbi:Ankyrin repeats (3 copies) [Popillia japonica]|uniref:Ankyrin repeats (3 copies) n=1 Tax=Popillia japonica TaxID=7064 RepID=A0AAW1LCZ5_POPJA
MSYRSKQPIPPTRRRSSSAVRSGGTTTNPSSGYHRPRSYMGSHSSPFSSALAAIPSNTPYSSFTPSSAYKNYSSSGYSSNYKSPYFQNTSRSSAGYASLTIPAKALTNINVVTPNYSKMYDNSREYAIPSDTGHRSRQMTRNGSFSRDSSLTRSQSSLNGSGMGSRSHSLTSLNSEGYISGNDRSSRSSRVSSTNDLILRGENGEIDYKKLYEQTLVENERLKDKLRKTDEELKDTKQTLEKLTTVTSKNSLSELEKREKRAMERKLSEMEEELKQFQKLKAENERLRAENRALTRVVNKLSISAEK